VQDAREYLNMAARLAARAEGDVEPNPMVGCVITRDAHVIGMGHHRRYGEAHAEVEALRDCKARGHDPAGATVYVSLEPCAHHGKQPPCTQALIEARVARVVCARRDPHQQSGEGAQELRKHRIEVEFTDASPLATHLADPFVKRVETGLPWIIAKWAQTIDGRVATRTGESQWISSKLSRRRVHRLRARVDAILTGIGTVSADDPTLTARGVRRVRRVARRVVVDPDMRIPLDSTLVRTTDVAPVTVACSEGASIDEARWEALRRLEARRVEVIALPLTRSAELDLEALLRRLVDRENTTRVLLEAGPRLLGSMFDEGLIDEAIVYVAPIMFADDRPRSAARGRVVEHLNQALPYRLVRAKRLGEDVELWYRREPARPDHSVI